MNEFRIKIVLTREKKKSRKVMNERKWQHVNLKHTKEKKTLGPPPKKNPAEDDKTKRTRETGPKKTYKSTFSPPMLLYK